MTDPCFRDRLADVLAHHAFSHVNSDGWTVCLCGHVAEGDDDDGSHARHQADTLIAGPQPREIRDQLRAASERARSLPSRARPVITRPFTTATEPHPKEDS